jgi:type III secretory pathway component EscS
MSTSPTVTARDFVLWVFSMGTLVASIVSFIALKFEYINRLFGDAPVYDLYSTGIRIAMATLIVIFPLYVWTTRYLNEDIREHPAKRDLWVRKWLIYIGLFVAAIALIVDLVVLINAYLGGQEITLAFLLKVLTVFVVVGAAFMYYLRSLAGVWERNEKMSIYIGYAIGAIVLLTVVSGFFIIGSPAELRALRTDQDRIYDLQNLQSGITNYYQQKQALPESLDALADPLTGYVVPVDPVTEEPYRYNVVNASELTFELCATFDRESPEDQSSGMDYYYERYSTTYWQHGVGEECFERTVDPDQYPPYDRNGAIKPIPARM